MAINQSIDLTPPAANGAGPSVSMLSYSAATFYVRGTFNATIQIQISDNNIDWFNFGAPIVSPGGFLDMPTTRALNVRAFVSAYVAGAPVVKAVGLFALEGG